MKLNNHGQTLVMFVILLPLLVMIISLVVDSYKMILEKEKLNNMNYIIIDYGLDHLREANNYQYMEDIILKNDLALDSYDINITSNYIQVTLEKTSKGIFSHIFDIKLFKVKSTYQGEIINGKKKIERVK